MGKHNIRLTLKTAKALIKQELGLSGAALKVEMAKCDVYIYTMELGNYEITVENDWFERNGLYSLNIASRSQGSIQRYFDPDTLEENDEAGDKWRKEVREEICECCPHAKQSL